jgi:hypothetical protein
MKRRSALNFNKRLRKRISGNLQKRAVDVWRTTHPILGIHFVTSTELPDDQAIIITPTQNVLVYDL